MRSYGSGEAVGVGGELVQSAKCPYKKRRAHTGMHREESRDGGRDWHDKAASQGWEAVTGS